VKLEDLDFSNDEPTNEGLQDQTAANEAAVFLADLELLIDEDHVQYARDTLESIYETVSDRGFVTDRQRQAVENIDEGGMRYRSGRLF